MGETVLTLIVATLCALALQWGAAPPPPHHLAEGPPPAHRAPAPV